MCLTFALARMQVRGFPKTPQWESPVSPCLALALARMQARGFPKVFSRGVSGWTCVSPWRLQGCKSEGFPNFPKGNFRLDMCRLGTCKDASQRVSPNSRGISGWTCVSPWMQVPILPKGNFRLDMCLALALARMQARVFPKTSSGEFPVGHVSRLGLQGCKSETFPKLSKGNFRLDMCLALALARMQVRDFFPKLPKRFPVRQVSLGTSTFRILGHLSSVFASDDGLYFVGNFQKVREATCVIHCCCEALRSQFA